MVGGWAMSSTDTESRGGDLVAITAALARGDRPGALELAHAALQRVENLPLLRHLEEGLARQSGSTPDVSAAPELWRRYGGTLARAGHLEEGRAALEIALALEPDSYRARIDAGTVAFMRAELEDALTHFEHAAALMPGDPEPLASLAAIAARQQRHGDARVLAERALALRPGLVTAHMAIARADLLEGHAERTDSRMTELLVSAALNDAQRIGALDLRAEARDALDRTADAFADYAARNAILERVNAPRIALEAGERRIEQARRLAGWFERTPLDPWRARPGADTTRPVREHVFLLGFPRSGTTLLEKVLAGHPDISTLPEVDHLAAAGEHLLADDASLQSLATLAPAQARTLREDYWRNVEASVTAPLAGRVLVDKMPLHTVALPLIARLFPDAKVLFALRDPRDVVLSCFRRRFQVNAAMFEFLTLEGAARYYDAVMSLARRYREFLPLRFHEVRHEAMVADLEGEARKVLEFIGADWNPAVLDFAGRARSRLVTPSDPQLARGLSSEGVGQWRRYEPCLRPVLGLLEPWVTRYGYPTARGTEGPR